MTRTPTHTVTCCGLKAVLAVVCHTYHPPLFQLASAYPCTPTEASPHPVAAAVREGRGGEGRGGEGRGGEGRGGEGSGGLHTCLTDVVVMVSCTHHFAIKLTKVVLTLAANVEWVFERSASSPFIDSHALLSVLQG